MSKQIINIINNLPLKTTAKIVDITSSINILSSSIYEIIPNGEIIVLGKDKDKVDTIININLKNKNKINNNVTHSALNFDYDMGNNLPLQDNAYDLVIMSHTLRNVIYRESLLKECFRILSPGGMILIVELHHDAHGVTTHPDARILFDDILEYLDNSGFIIGDNFDTDQYEYGIIGICPQV